MPIRLPSEPIDSALYLKGYYDAKLDYEVKHGRWKKIGHIEHTWLVSKCSECGYQTIDAGSYCTNCGAKMDAEEGEKHD